jgi:uncharacterized damage-inducible protein DinB
VSGSWVSPDSDPREGGYTRGERATLVEYLRAYRLTMAMKCEDLTPQQLALRSVPPSTLSLLGLVRHLADVEFSWFRRVMGRRLDIPRMWDKSERPDGDFDGAVGTQECVDEAFALWRAEIAHAESFVDAAESLDVRGLHGTDGEIELREVLVHLIEEYARHCGHADLLRECIDGRTGS